MFTAAPPSPPHPFEDEGGPRLEGLPAERAPLHPVHLRPRLLLQVLVEVVPQHRRQGHQGHTVAASVALITPGGEGEGGSEGERERGRERETGR